MLTNYKDILKMKANYKDIPRMSKDILRMSKDILRMRVRYPGSDD